MVILAALLLGCGRCGSVEDLASADVLYIGDSILGWNEKTCRSIPAYAARERGVSYANVAQNGALLLSGEKSIPEQTLDGDWDVVVMDGGANDLNGGCECGDCDLLMERLITEDGSQGVMPDLVSSWTERGSDVLMLGYYPVPDSAWYGFDRCFDTLTELDRRYALLAESRDGVEFFDLGDVIDPDGEGGVYAFDNAHPSPKGAELLGAAVAAHLP